MRRASERIRSPLRRLRSAGRAPIIGLGTKLCREKGSEAYCYYADISASLVESLADISSQTNTSAVLQGTIGWRPPVKSLSLSATGSLQAVYFSDYQGGRQGPLFV